MWVAHWQHSRMISGCSFLESSSEGTSKGLRWDSFHNSFHMRLNFQILRWIIEWGPFEPIPHLQLSAWTSLAIKKIIIKAAIVYWPFGCTSFGSTFFGCPSHLHHLVQVDAKHFHHPVFFFILPFVRFYRRLSAFIDANTFVWQSRGCTTGKSSRMILSGRQPKITHSGSVISTPQQQFDSNSHYRIVWVQRWLIDNLWIVTGERIRIKLSHCFSLEHPKFPQTKNRLNRLTPLVESQTLK